MIDLSFWLHRQG